MDTGRYSWGKALIGAFWALVGLVTLAHVVYYLPRTVDDLFISLRYARNLVSGHGLVYNLGERVEGFSSPLWVLLQAAGMGAGLEGVAWTKVLGLASLVAFMAGVYAFGRRRLCLAPACALLPCLLLAANPFVISWSILGLETPAFLALVVWMAVLLGDYLRVASRSRGVALGVVTLALVACRPEAPLFVAAAWAAALWGPPAWSSAVRKIRLLVPVGIAVALVVAILLGARLLYYGDLLPHTVHPKTGTPMGFVVVTYLVWRGVTVPEVIAVLGGVGALCVTAVRGKDAILVAVVVVDLVFAGLVTEDWMPNNRFMLPVYVASALGWGWVLDRLWRSGWPVWVRAVSASALPVALVASLVPLAAVDSRCSNHDLFHFEFKWNSFKSLSALRESADCLRRVEPKSVKFGDVHAMGMITQAFCVIEHSRADPAQEWFVGRDIGRVGYYTDVKIFETDGLFTREVAADETLRERGVPSGELLVAVLNRKPVCTDLLGPWAYSLGVHRNLLDGWSISRGSRFVPFVIHPPGQVRPDLHEISDRYDDLVERMPSLFHMQTLYGEAVSANVIKRARFVRRLAERGGVVDRSDVPDDLPGAGVMFGKEVVRLHGCTVDPPAVSPGSETYLECYFERLGDPPFQYWIFVHVEGMGIRVTADHLPLNDLVPLASWEEGAVVRDVCHVPVPPSLPAGRYRVFLGFFNGGRRVKASPDDLTDEVGRAIGPEVDVVW